MIEGRRDLPNLTVNIILKEEGLSNLHTHNNQLPLREEIFFEFLGKKNLSLSDVVADLSGKYTVMRRREILTRGRDLLLSDYHNTMLAAGDGTWPLVLRRCDAMLWL